MKSLTEQFTDWVRTKPRDETYDWMSISGCALFQFYDAHGLPIAHVGRTRWVDHNDEEHAIPSVMGDAAMPPPHTFGALADRLTLNQNGGG